MYLVFADQYDPVAAAVSQRLTLRHGAEQVVWLTSEALVQAVGWTYFHPASQALSHVRLADGRNIAVSEITAVFNRLHELNLPHFEQATEADRAYARSEFFAFLLSWLANLSCPVINPPQACSLCGLSRSAFGSLRQAAQAGFEVPRFRFVTNARCLRKPGDATEQLFLLSAEAPLYDLNALRPATAVEGRTAPAFLAEALSVEAQRLVCVGGEIVSELSASELADAWRTACRKLARSSGLNLFECRLARTTDEAAPVWKLTHFNAFPQQLNEAETERLAQWMEQGATQPNATASYPTTPRRTRKKQGRVLFCGVPSEPPLSRAIAAAEELGLSYSLFNQRATHAMEIELALQAGQVGGRLCLPTGKVKLESFDGLYLRLMGWESLPENQNATPPQREKSRLQHEALSDWADLAPHRVCNRPSAMASNFSKPYQAQFIERSGLATPPTLVTNEPDALRQFVKEHRRVIYKSVSSVRSIVREIGPVELTRLDKLRSLPTQFQAYIPGVNWRVHVVGQHLFATRIESEAVDYRYAQRDGHEIEMRALALPDEIAERCLSLSALLSLPFCGIDLKQTPEGQFYCFEVNPSPAYTYYQAHTGQPIAQALTRWLAYGES